MAHHVRFRRLALAALAAAPLFGQSTTIGNTSTPLPAAVLRGSAYKAGKTAVINAAGNLDGVAGNPTDCVLVNGTSAACAAAAIASINGSAAAAQTLATGTAGTDFALVDAGGTHTFNLPVADAAHTGKLAAADWVKFNAPAETTVTFTDVTTNNASAAKHGFLPKLPNDASKCLLGDGTYGTCGAPVAGVGISVSGATITYNPADPRTAWIKDEWCGHSNGGGGTAYNGELGWVLGWNSGGPSGADIAVDANHPCVAELTTSGAAGDDGAFVLTNRSMRIDTVPSGGRWDFYTIFRMPTVTNTMIKIGFVDGAEGSIFNGSNNGWQSSYLRYVNTVDTFFMLVNCNNGGNCSNVATAVTPLAGTWYQVHIFSTVSGTLQMDINNGTPVSLGTNVTNTLVSPCIYARAVAGSARTLDVDWFFWGQQGTVRF